MTNLFFFFVIHDAASFLIDPVKVLFMKNKTKNKFLMVILMRKKVKCSTWGNLKEHSGEFFLNLTPPSAPTAQRSAHELPMVEKQDTDSCSVLGGQQMILTGQNFSSDSKVVFMEKTQGEWVNE